MNSNNTIVKMEMSGNRYNAFDADGNKFTSEIGTGTRKRAYEQGMALERRTGKSGRVYWWKVPMSECEKSTAPVFSAEELAVPNEHAEGLNFIHSSYKLKVEMLLR